MSKNSTRPFLGFLAGFLSHLIFQGALGAALYAAHLVPALPWSLEPLPPFGVPRSLALGFWAGVWGIAYALLEPWLTGRLGRWSGGLVFGLAGPLLVFWFVVLPTKGLGVAGGFDPATMPIHIAFHAAFGIGVAVIFWLSLSLARGTAHPSPEALRG